jgi:hypothetical protein
LYDTSAGLLTAPEVVKSPRWGTVLTRLKPATGEVTTKHILNTDEGLHLTLLNGVTLVAERSLPKALYGTNVRELDQADVAPALDRVDREIASALRVALPPFGEWQPTRADYCRNDQLGDELAVRRALHDARDVQLARKGRPVSGDSGTSLSWPGRSYGFKLYGKHVESGEPLAVGVLRAEATVRHLSTFRALLGLPKGAPVQLLDVLQPDVRTEVLARFSDVFRRCPVSGRELSDRDFCREFTAFFSGGRSWQLVGFCVLYRLAGSPRAGELAKRGASVFGFKRSTVYRALADLRRFRLHLQAKGFAPVGDHGAEEDGLDDLADVAVEDERLIDYVAGLTKYMGQAA